MDASECHILLIEDDENDAFFFRRIAAKLGFPGKLVAAATPEEGWHLLKQHASLEKFHLVVSDGFWKSTDVRDLIVWMRHHPDYEQVPVVIYSGVASEHQRDLALATGADAVLMKPAHADEMDGRVREVLLHLPEHCRTWLQ